MLSFARVLRRILWLTVRPKFSGIKHPGRSCEKTTKFPNAISCSRRRRKKIVEKQLEALKAFNAGRAAERTHRRASSFPKRRTVHWVEHRINPKIGSHSLTVQNCSLSGINERAEREHRPARITAKYRELCGGTNFLRRGRELLSKGRSINRSLIAGARLRRRPSPQGARSR